MASHVLLKIITPHGIFWNEPVEIVTLKTTEGYIGLQKQKSPFVASLDIAELKINSHTSGSHFKVCAIAGGLVFTDGKEINVITDAIEFKENIDLVRAERAKREAELAVQNVKSEAEQFQAQLALKRAINRIHVRSGK